MNIVYVGKSRSVVVEVAQGDWGRCERNVPVAVDDELAAKLLKQPDVWRLDGPPPAPPKRPAKNAPKAKWVAYIDAIDADGDGVPATQNHTVDELIAFADAAEARAAAKAAGETPTPAPDTTDQEV